MKNTLKNALALGLPLFALAAVSAQAQTTIADPTLTQIFHTDANGTTINQNQYGVGVGYDASNANNAFSGSLTNDTAQAVYNPFILDSTLAAGSSFQIGVHGQADNRLASGPVSIFASIFAFSPTIDATNPVNTGSATVPIQGPALISNLEIKFTNSGTDSLSDQSGAGDQHIVPAGDTFYSATTTLGTTLTAGTKYVIAFAPDTAAGGSASSYVDLFLEPTARINALDNFTSDPTSVPAASDNQFQDIYTTDNNSANSGGLGSRDHTTPGFNAGSSANPIAYRIYAGAASPAPEPSSFALFGLVGIGLSGLLIRARRASRTAA